MVRVETELPADLEGPVTTTVTRRVRPGHEAAYEGFLAGTLEDPEFSEADMEAALERLPDAPAIA